MNSTLTLMELEECMDVIYWEDHMWWHDILACSPSDLSCLTKWNTIHVAAIIPGIGSILCSIYIIFSGIYYYMTLMELGFSAQLAIYISICDLIFELSHTSDHVHNLLTGFVSEGALCQTFGSLKPFGINCQTAWALATSYYICYTILRAEEPSFGKYNMYIHIPCWGVPLIIMIIGFGLDVYGIEGPWCGIPDPVV